MKNMAVDLRNHLFATLEDLRDTDKPMDLARAKAVAEVAQTLINLAKVEVDAYRAADRADVPGFLASVPQPLRAIAGGK